MPSFLSKVLGRKKDEKETSRSGKRSSVASLLEGKFEAVSPSISPSATNFADSAPRSQEKEREKSKHQEKDTGFSLFRSRSRPVSPLPESPKTIPEVPRLTLNLPVPKEERSRALGVVFEADPDDRSTLPDAVIGERRLNPLEALLLVKACSTAIIEHGGLETLGVMHPHWYSASPDVQRRLISLFILSLAPKSPITTLSPTPTSPSLIFNTELEYTRSPHDLAAVLRWALRHVRLEGDSFGGTTDQWQWYRTFAEAERTSSYPPSAFSTLLVPKLPPAHLQLLVATLEIVSSLAAHSERNGISGSKLSKFLGIWLLTSRRSEEDDDWSSFYLRWERAGRMLEHLFLAQLRDEMVHKKMPLRLSELVASYPYGRADAAAEDELLPRPRPSTRRYDALYVRVESQLPDRTATKPKQHPLRLVIDALRAENTSKLGEHYSVWEALQKAASSSDAGEPGGYPALTRVFEDETTRIFSLVPAESSDDGAVGPSRQRSKSAPQDRRANGKATGNGHGEAVPPLPSSTTQPTSPKDWVDFSTTGFGDSALGKDFAKTLLDSDLEKTSPPSTTGRASKKPRLSPEPSRRSSVDAPRATPQSPERLPSTLAAANIVQLDEAFIDFWSDALLDPISSEWPNFAVCQLKPLPGVQLDGKPLSWLVLEQTFTHPPPPPSPEPQPTSPTSPRRNTTPGRRSSLKSNGSARRSSTFSAAKRRFNLFASPSQTFAGPEAKARKKVAKSPKVGEMGELLPEEPQTPASPASAEQRTGLGLSGVVTEPAPGGASNKTEAAEAKTTDLPPVPVVDAQVPTPATAPITSEPIMADEEPAGDRPTVAVPQEPAVPSDAPPALPEKDQAPEATTLPPAPESVVLTGETPGPQVALDTSEPAAFAEASAQVQGEAEVPPLEPEAAQAEAAESEPTQQAEFATALATAEPVSVPESTSVPTEDAAEVIPSQSTAPPEEPSAAEQEVATDATTDATAQGASIVPEAEAEAEAEKLDQQPVFTLGTSSTIPGPLSAEPATAQPIHTDVPPEVIQPEPYPQPETVEDIKDESDAGVGNGAPQGEAATPEVVSETLPHNAPEATAVSTLPAENGSTDKPHASVEEHTNGISHIDSSIPTSTEGHETSQIPAAQEQDAIQSPSDD
ncbi:hypothetical protein OBBRIDRAFT_129203 [Obba rivulosa]|uniref:Meiotically up-regulated protein Msb1/Mug8 domain-containing protein n=1 Tax=Obba rivulosa TaxID=1052685 RepID=A0A8E2ATR7_9APHY|nr:hypothetical protein OBBRIDRAFT_129203 [Obba rivulosa]